MNNGGWSSAAVATANGVNRLSSASRLVMLLVALGIIAIVVVVLLVVMH
nr:hypothetical protein [Mycobacterium leprae]